MSSLSCRLARGAGPTKWPDFLQGVITKHKLMSQSIVVVNKSGGAGGEGFLDVKGSRADGHKIIISLSNLFTTPLATGLPFNWKDLTPVAMLALDEFVLWVHADSPYKQVGDLTKAIQRWRTLQVQDGGDRFQASRTRSSRLPSKRPPVKKSPTSLSRGAVMWRCNWWASTLT